MPTSPTICSASPSSTPGSSATGVSRRMSREPIAVACRIDDVLDAATFTERHRLLEVGVVAVEDVDRLGLVVVALRAERALTAFAVESKLRAGRRKFELRRGAAVHRPEVVHRVVCGLDVEGRV